VGDRLPPVKYHYFYVAPFAYCFEPSAELRATSSVSTIAPECKVCARYGRRLTLPRDPIEDISDGEFGWGGTSVKE
jgi:hypothetical protein